MPRGSQREYARHRGCSHVAVGKAVKTGRIGAAVGDDGKIDFALADKLWSANTDAIKQALTDGGKKTRGANPRQPSSKPPPSAPSPTDSPKPLPEVPTSPAMDQGGVSLVKAQTMRAVYAAQREKLKFEEESSKKIDRDEVRVRAFTRARRARDMLQSAPARIAPLLVGLDLIQMTLKLEEEFRRVAQEISDDGTAPL